MLPSHWVMDCSDKNVTLAVPRVRPFYEPYWKKEKKRFVGKKRVSGCLLSYRHSAQVGDFGVIIFKCPVFLFILFYMKDFGLDCQL